MIDTLFRSINRASGSGILQRLKLEPKQFCAMTLHRPSNVDDKETLSGILDALETIGKRFPIVFPVHPRTQKRLEEFGLNERLRNQSSLLLTEPLAYLDFLHLYSNSRLVLTDSGGIQEETTALGIPCLTLRPNTERPITVNEGTNRVVGNEPRAITRAALEAFEQDALPSRVPELWDGHAAIRIVDALEEFSEIRI
jgi:UDP-N-acetylglucosamine 2-epimerase (non-hydrolysing)